VKTFTIAYRVADFLKKHPPFDCMEEEDLVAIAAAGRVSFHEDGEIIFEEGLERSAFFYVIQQGTVRLVRHGLQGEQLVDLRGEGDLLGISWFLGEPRYIHTARTDTEVILYALPWDVFLPRLQRYRQATRYLAAYFSIRPTYDNERLARTGEDEQPSSLATHASAGEDGLGAATWLDESGPINQRAREALITAREATLVRDAARQMAASSHEALVIIDRQGRPRGIVTETDLCNRVATGEVAVDAPISTLMASPVVTIPPGLHVGELILRMLAARLRHLCITEDGTPGSRATGLVAERDLHALHGRLPTFLAKEIRSAGGSARLAALRKRAGELMLIALDSRASIRWVGRLIQHVDHGIFERSLQLAEAELAATGLNRPPTPYCWVAAGREGRGERYLPTEQRNFIIYDDRDAQPASGVEHWFHELGSRVCGRIGECGFPCEHDALSAFNRDWVMPLSRWRDTYTRWISEPSARLAAEHAPFFDLAPLSGKAALLDELRAHIAAQLQANPGFVPRLARETLAQLPPITIFRNGVVDREGIMWTCVDTRQHMLGPLVGVGRVLALRRGDLRALTTSGRFLAARESFPAHTTLLESAAEAVRTALYFETHSGLHHGGDGRFIRADEMSKLDQERVKGIFRTVIDAMEFAQSIVDGQPTPTRQPAP